MKHFRLGLALTILSIAGTAQSAPVNAPQADVVGHLSAAFATHDAARITHAYRTMGEYASPAADIVESMVNAMGYDLLGNGEIDAAIKVFEMNAQTFPSSANTWDSLAEAVMAKGAYESAIRYYRVSLELDPESDNAAKTQAVLAVYGRSTS
jgi:tetratricopeptide (TPR) repeat protein